MIKIAKTGVFLKNGREPETNTDKIKQKYGRVPSAEEARRGTMAYSILVSHNTEKDSEKLKIKFDSLTSHDITFVNAIQTAKASGLEKFPVPYVMTNCHNSLCAVGGTINEDDHRFGLSAARKYGGVYVPAHMAVIHQVMRELYAGCGKMILGTDSHTRYGAIGTLGIGEGGGEMVKQLLSKTYDIKMPEVVCVYLTGKPAPGVGPQDVALSLVGATFKTGAVKNKILEFVGEGIKNLSMDFRNGIDTMTTETSCLSSIWETDEKTERYLELHGRKNDYKKLSPAEWAYYDGFIEIDLSKVRPMIALPFHPSNVYKIEELNANPYDILSKAENDAVSAIGKKLNLTDKIRGGRIFADQGIIAGCAGGTYENLMAAADILKGKATGSGDFSLSVYPASQPVMLDLIEKGAVKTLAEVGAIIKTAFCGPCFGAGDVPFNGALSVRHTTRNFPYREGSRPSGDQFSSVALMDARSVAATAANGGALTPATDVAEEYTAPEYVFDDSAYKSRIYNGFKEPKDTELAYGPNIVDWPEIQPLQENLLLKVVSYINDPVTTTDELIPSGETASYRSNPLALAEFTLSRRDPQYVSRAKEVFALEEKRRSNENVLPEIFAKIKEISEAAQKDTGIGSAIFAVKPGDGSAREQAASCQRVLGGCANIANEYATKRYRSNLINWGMAPFVINGKPAFENGDYIFVPKIRKTIESGGSETKAYVIGEKCLEISLSLGELTENERRILLSGCLINDYRKK